MEYYTFEQLKEMAFKGSCWYMGKDERLSKEKEADKQA